MRRWVFVALAALLLALPGALTLRGEGSGAHEQRVLAPLPAWPTDVDAALALPARIEAALSDRLGLRALLVVAQERLRWHLFHEFAAGKLVAGRHGRVFLAQHDDRRRYSLIQDSCGYAVDPERVKTGIRDAALALDAAAKLAPAASMLIVPSAAPIYADLLPPWLRAQCAASRPPGTVLAASRPDAIAYPLDILREFRAEGGEPIPLQGLHWRGAGAERIVDWYATTRLHRAPLGPRPAPEPVLLPSELDWLEPGILAPALMERPAFYAAGIVACETHPCVEGESPLYARLASSDYVWRREPAPGRLLILSDSFGVGAAPYFGRYFGQVRHVNVSGSMDWSPELLRALRHELFEVYQPDHILLLFHDSFFGTFPWLFATYWLPAA